MHFTQFSVQLVPARRWFTTTLRHYVVGQIFAERLTYIAIRGVEHFALRRQASLYSYHGKPTNAFDFYRIILMQTSRLFTIIFIGISGKGIIARISSLCEILCWVEKLVL